MAAKAIIIVPAQGDHHAMFEDVARQVRRRVYSGAAKVIRAIAAKRSDGVIVSFGTTDGKPFSWDDVQDLKSVITISHGGSVDGPNLNYGAGDEAYQAWGSRSDGTSGLSDAGGAFWKLIANELKPSGKIILVGCLMGSWEYAGYVAKETGHTVYASDGLFAAADTETTVRHVRAIERGAVMRPMKRFDP